jgi:hypothetical protein
MVVRMEYFNVLNRMQICGPDTGVDDGANFGVVSPTTVNGVVLSSPCQGNTARQGQVFVKFNF